MRSDTELKAALQEARTADRAKNGPIYPKGSLHAKGVELPGCDTCSCVAALSWVLGLRDEATIGFAQLQKHLPNADAIAEKELPFGRVNDW